MTNAWSEAKKHFAGGVNSPVRAFKAVGGEPIFMSRGIGPYLYDKDGNPYIDYCLSWGAVILGHAHEAPVQAITEQASKGTSFGTVTEYETLLAAEIKKAFPKIERLRFTSSGTEAAMSVIRLARGVTRRNAIVKFDGCYHGHADSLLVKAGSGLATFGRPDSAGVPGALAELTTVLPYNDAAAVKTLFRKRSDIACVIVEPIAGNMGVVPASQEFLDTLRSETKKAGALLIFDEVITGFRVAYGGAQHLYGIDPDITVLGKIIGGGLPMGAFGASEKIMNALSPEGLVYQAGTLSGNPLSMAAGRAVLSRLSKDFYSNLESKSREFEKRLVSSFKRKGQKRVIRRKGSMFTIFFVSKAPENLKDVMATDKKAFTKFFRNSLSAGVYVPPSAFEASFISESHSEIELAKTLEGWSRS